MVVVVERVLDVLWVLMWVVWVPLWSGVVRVSDELEPRTVWRLPLMRRRLGDEFVRHV